MDKKLSLMITGTITISVTLSMASAYLLDSNNFSFRDFKGYYQNAENFRHSMLIDGQRMRSQRNGTQAEPDFEKMAQTIFRRVDTNSDNVTTISDCSYFILAARDIRLLANQSLTHLQVI